MKYVIVQKGDLEVPIIFPESVTHRDVLNTSPYALENVVSAGFCSVTTGKEGEIEVVAWGESISLGKKSRSEDGLILTIAVKLRA